MYILELDENKRIISVTQGCEVEGNCVEAENLPQGNVFEYLYIDGEYVYNPLPVEPFEEKPTQIDILEAQITYTAMMTDTLLEVE